MKNEPFNYKGIYESHYNFFRKGYEYSYEYNLMKCDKQRVNPVLINWGVLNTPYYRFMEQWGRCEFRCYTNKLFKKEIEKALTKFIVNKVTDKLLDMIL